jgi:hypothetical protein
MHSMHSNSFNPSLKLHFFNVGRLFLFFCFFWGWFLMFSHQVPKVHIRFSKYSPSSQCVPKEVPNRNSFFCPIHKVWPWLNFHLFYLFHGKHNKAWQNMLLFWVGEHNWASMLGDCPHVPKILVVGQSNGSFWNKIK